MSLFGNITLNGRVFKPIAQGHYGWDQNVPDEPGHHVYITPGRKTKQGATVFAVRSVIQADAIDDDGGPYIAPSSLNSVFTIDPAGNFPVAEIERHVIYLRDLCNQARIQEMRLGKS